MTKMALPRKPLRNRNHIFRPVQQIARKDKERQSSIELVYRIDLLDQAHGDEKP